MAELHFKKTGQKMVKTRKKKTDWQNDVKMKLEILRDSYFIFFLKI